MPDEGGHILVVDDDAMNRLKLTRGLELQGHTVMVAQNGRQALSLLGEQSFDVVLLDIMMPEMDGFQVLAEMKQDRDLREIPVIVISGLDETDSAVRCIEMGAEDYLPKPFSPVLLRARLNASLEKKKLRDLERAYLQQEVMLRQSEKLATLGKLSAGMAHELNNPAAAARRGAEQLREAFVQFQQINQVIAGLELDSEQQAVLLMWAERAREEAGRPPTVDALTRSDRETELEDWLANHGLTDPWELAGTLVDLNLDLEQLSAIAGQFNAAQLGPLLNWLACTYTIFSLLAEIGQGAERITTIVTALKSYTYLDQAPLQTVDVHEGLDNTLVMLRGKLRDGIHVERHYAAALPRIEAYGSELNQVWTNIIDNAVDAMNGHGRIILRTFHRDRWVVVEIEDDGPGIPLEIQSQIFDPFFTTKPPGQGTGMGLNISHNIIVQKHKGQITVTSQPGETCFEIRLPLDPANLV